MLAKNTISKQILAYFMTTIMVIAMLPVTAYGDFLSAPGNVIGIPTDNSISLTWDEVTGATGYKITYGISGSTTTETTTTSTSYTITELMADTAYAIIIAPYDDIGTMANDTPIYVTTKEAIVNTDAEDLASDKAGMVAALNSGAVYPISNSTDKYFIIEVIRNSAIRGTELAWADSPHGFTLTPATTSATGSITGTINLTKGTATDTMEVNLTIPQLSAPEGITVTFEPNNGESTSDVTVADDMDIPTPTKADHTFDGWYDNVELTGTALTDAEIKALAASTTLYAKWEAEAPADNTDAEDLASDKAGMVAALNSGAVYPISNSTDKYFIIEVIRNSAIRGTELAWADSPHGFTLTPATTSATGSITGTINLTKGTATDTMEVNLTIPQLSAPEGITVTFEPNNGESTSNVTVEDDMDIPTPTKDGHTFGGWYDNVELTGTALTDAEIKALTASTTLYAKWEAEDSSDTKTLETILAELHTAYVENTSIFSLYEVDHNTEVEAQTRIKNICDAWLSDNSYSGITVEVITYFFTSASEESDGSYSFDIKLTRGDESFTSSNYYYTGIWRKADNDGYVFTPGQTMAYKYIPINTNDDDVIDFSNIDVHGLFNGEWKAVTFFDGGFKTILKKNDAFYNVVADGTTHMVDGLDIKITASPDNNGGTIKITYEVTNNGSSEETFSLATGADVKIGYDDFATVRSFDKGFIMTSTIETYDQDSNGGFAQFNAFLKGIEGVTDVDGLWYGDYYGRYTELGVADETGAYNWPREQCYFFSNPASLPDGTDSVAAWHWADREIPAGATQTYSIKLGIGGEGSEDVVAPPTTSSYTVTVNNSYGTTSGASDYAEGTIVTIQAGSRSGYAFSGWNIVSGDVTLADENSPTTTFEMPNEDVTITANWTAISSGNSGGSSGGGSGGSSNNDNGDRDITTQPEVKDPETSGGETNVEIETNPTTNLVTTTADITEDTLEEAVKDALEEVRGTENAPKVTIVVDTPARAEAVEVVLDSTALRDLIENENAVFEIQSDVGSMTFDREALNAVAEEANGAEVTLVIRKIEDQTELTQAQMDIIGDASTYELYIESDGKRISDFKGGTVKVKVPEELNINENSTVVVYYIDGDGNVEPVSTSYNSTDNTVTFTTKHFSHYVIQVIGKANPSTGR